MNVGMNVVVVGASRGIGLGFTEQYLAEGNSVLATYRGETIPSSLTELQQKYPGTLSLHPLEVTDPKARKQFADTVKKVDILILNAGIKGYPVPHTRPPGNTSDELTEALAVNTVAPDAIIRELYPVLKEQKDACVVFMGSKVGLASDDKGGGYHPYRISKAGSHLMIWNWSIELMQDWKKNHEEDLAHTPCAVAICAGWVKTDMGGQNADQTVDESVSQMRQVIRNVIATKASNGLLMYDGTIAEKYPVPQVLEQVFEAKKNISVYENGSTSPQE